MPPLPTCDRLAEGVICLDDPAAATQPGRLHRSPWRTQSQRSEQNLPLADITGLLLLAFPPILLPQVLERVHHAMDAMLRAYPHDADSQLVST